MREIKFRAKTNDMMSHGTWVYGFYVDAPIPVIDLKEMKQTGERPGGYIITDNDGESNLKKRRVCPNTVGQFTGLKDKNGVEIYEGDILASSKARHIVEYQEKEGAFMGVNPNYGKDMLSGEDFSTPLHQGWITRFEKEVIGNIHDNPELLR